MAMKPCPECKGQEPTRSDCKRCGGSGVVWRTDTYGSSADPGIHAHQRQP